MEKDFSEKLKKVSRRDGRSSRSSRTASSVSSISVGTEGSGERRKLRRSSKITVSEAEIKEMKALTVESDSSSDEEDHEIAHRRDEAVGPSVQDDTDESVVPSNDFANFQAEFDTPYVEETEIQEYVPPTFLVAELEQRPEEPVDVAPLENVPVRQPPEIYLESKTLLSNVTLCKPISNPLTGNVILCRHKQDKVVIHEMTLQGMEVACTVLLDAELQRKIMSVYGMSALKVTRVLQLAAGLHKPPGQTRMRLSALVEFQVLTPSGSTQTQISLVVWQWGYATSQQPIALQSLLSPPNHADFTYQATSLQMGDGLVFLAGYAQRKGPCVFVARPTVKDTWAANFLGQSTSSISCLAVTCEANRKHKLLAISMQDGSVSIWTYAAAVDRKAGKEETKVILPLCRLDGGSYIRKEPVTLLAADDEMTAKRMQLEDDDEIHFCTHLEWKTPDSSHSSLLYLAAAYTNGIAIFHVKLPLLMDTIPPEAISEASSVSGNKRGSLIRSLPAPKASTQLAQTVSLRPFSVAHWAAPSDWSGISWVDLGPHVPPSLAVWLEEEDVSAACMLGVIDLEDGGKFRLLCEHFLPHSTGCLLSTSSMGSILCYGNGKIEALTPSANTDASFFASIRHPISAAPPGLDSAGYVSSTNTDKDGILHVFTVSQCERKRCPEMESTVPNTTRLDWIRPIQRHFLVRSFVGDTKNAQEMVDGDETGGSYANVICELTCGPAMIPHRVVKSTDSPLCAVLFRRSLASVRGIALDPQRIHIYDTSNGKLLESRDGRDIVFLPAKEGPERALVLGVDGTMIYMMKRRSAADGENEETGAAHFDDGMPFRPLLGFESDQDYIDCRRLLAVFSGTEVGMVVVGKRVSDGNVCIVAGNRDILQDDISRLIPHVKEGCLWLRHGEEVLSLSELPRYEQEGRHCIAVATQTRVMLVSPARLNIRAETNCHLATSSLASIGSHAVAFICCENKVRYLCCLDGKYRQGIIATLPEPRFGHAAYTLMALRPERFLYAQYHAGSRLVEQGENRNSFQLPTCVTRPAMLLEPIVANALCEADNPGESTILLRAVIERFGRKVGSFPHGDDEGIGVNGTGLTQQVVEMLSAYGLKHPASWLLTGTIRFERDSPSKVLPSWMPISTKSIAALNPDAQLHVISNGDQYFMDYIKSPDHNMASTLPRPSDPSAIFCRELAKKAMRKGDVAGALKLLDLAGSEASDNAMLHMVLAMQADPFADVMPALKALSGVGEDGRSGNIKSTSSSIAAIALELRDRQQKGKIKVQNGEIPKLSEEFCRRWVHQLAPSVQCSYRAQRIRQRLIGEEAIDKAVTQKLETVEQDTKWNTPCNESRHVWNEGPFKDRENLLLLDRMEEWLGRKRPNILGKEGAEIALERGEKTLADILNRANEYDDDSFGGAAEMDMGDGSGWIDGIGTGRTDEDNLSAYFRMSEGADEDSGWRADGLADLTKYQNKIKVIGHDIIKLQETTSSVDEGEPGKIKLLYDIVFDEPQDDSPAGFLMEVPRGGSCDVGMLHGPMHDSRKRCTIEFWFHVPMAEDVLEDIVLARRSVTKAGDDLSKLCVASDRESALWELVLLPTGELEFRSSGGTILNSTDGVEEEGDFGKNSDMMGDFGGDDDSATEMGTNGEISWQRSDGGGGWNHITLIFSSKSQDDMSECSITLMMKGIRVVSGVARIEPPGLDGDELEDSTTIDGVMANSVILFGLNPVGNLRFTDIRVWSCVRSEDDIKMMMYEYLRAAEMKKKFKVKIRKQGESQRPKSSDTGRKLLAPPKSGTGRLAPPPSSESDRPRGGLLPPPRSRREKDDSDEPDEVVVTSGMDEDLFAFIPPLLSDKGDTKKEVKKAPLQLPAATSLFPATPIVDASGFPTAPAAVSDPAGLPPVVPSSPWDVSAAFFPTPAGTNLPAPMRKGGRDSTPKRNRSKVEFEETGGSTGTPESSLGTADLVKNTISLSRQVRSSAAAALVRGPPATRHFGGNRGGLSRPDRSDRSDYGRFGVGSIAICGAEKTVVYKFDRSPPGKIYPIGASGAIISDEMDNDGSEYLCCFLAKDKRMVVFELTTKTVVVELQMTTKLNYWRYLPPQAHGHTLLFMLVTPVGGFHWMPLDESPRPRQVWKRGPNLQGKKIVAYEEGGSNGLSGPDARSTVALLLVSAASSGTPLEAWLMPVCGDSRALRVSANVLGAALFRPYQLSDAFLPLMVTADKMNEKEVILEVQPLVESLSTSSQGVGDVLACAIIDQRKVRKVNLTPPTLAMGTWPEVFVCCFEHLVIATIRRKGLLAAYEFKDGDLVLVRQEILNHYVVDAAVRPGMSKGEAEIVLLLSNSGNSRDGRVVSFTIEYTPM